MVYDGEVNEAAFEYYSRLGRVRNYIRANPGQRIRLSEAASIAGMERTYFSAFFRTKVGIPFSHWLSCHRVETAIQLMKSHNIAISELALKVGFQDLRTFERHFKRHTGSTPRDVKLSVRPA